MSSFKDVVEMAEALGLSKESVDKLKDKIKNQVLSTLLVAHRIKAGLTQKGMAELLECSVKKVRRVENSVNDNLHINDIATYCHALGLTIRIEIVGSSMSVCAVESSLPEKENPD